MKAIAAAAAVLLCFASCQKEAAIQPTIALSNSGTLKSSTALTFWESGSSAGCDGAACDCMAVTADPKDLTALSSVFTATSGGNPTAIKNAFSANRTVLISYAKSTDVDNVINGVSTARSVGTDPKNPRYLVIQTGAVRAVTDFK